ncbi:MAG: acyl-CoA synthetase [Pseudorhodoplanes sp.]|uniref:acyl-CoA synthetase n=1 Tax=Pseudorhodoplanes sp. TaxID=1934341 RepID=UPI003D12DF7E
MNKPRYREARNSFDWRSVAHDIGWDEDNRINLGHSIVDAHADTHKVALYWIDKSGNQSVWTYRELRDLSNRVANLLRSLGVGKGDRVAGVLSRRPETIAIMVAVWKAGGVYIPIFPAFGSEAVRLRVTTCEAKAIFVHGEYRDRIPQMAACQVVSICGDKGTGIERGDISFWHAVNTQPDTFELARYSRSDAAVILFTSGSTGEPKGVLIAANFIAAVRPYMVYCADLQTADIFWPTGDPSWGYGLVCYFVALSMGVPVVSYEGTPSPQVCLELLRDRKVTNLAAVPTLLRGIMALGLPKIASYQIVLRCISCCGEPLNAEVIRFFREAMGVTPMDHFGSSENGLPLGNFNGIDAEVRSGSMGLPVPGFDLAIVDDDGRERPDDEVGWLALRQSEQGLYALGYWKDEERTRSLFRNGWIIAGDLAKRDADGYFWFAGRSDDMIKSSGYRIGPFDVESAILHHPAVAEAGVIGKPDQLRGQIVKAFVVLKPGASRSPELEKEIQDTARRVLGDHAYPREVEIVRSLPKNEAGKIQRFQLRAAQASLPIPK